IRTRARSVCRRSFFFSSRRRHTRSKRDWSSDVCSSDLVERPVHREPLLVLAVVVPKIHFLRRAFLNRAADALAVAVRIERNLGEIGRASCRERGHGQGLDGGWKYNIG